MANFFLADAVYAAKALFDFAGVPGQVVIDHQVGALQIDAVACCVIGHQNYYVFVVGKGFYSSAALLATDTAVYDYHRFGFA